jgi:hypothetical protein
MTMYEDCSSGTGTPRAISIEKRTVSAMIGIYCRRHHGGREVCRECAALLAYSHKRLDGCPYGGDKPSCRECPVHCYRAAERSAMKDVMRFSGPKMFFRHPLLAVVHLWKEFVRYRGRPAPPPKRGPKRSAGMCDAAQ